MTQSQKFLPALNHVNEFIFIHDLDLVPSVNQREAS